MSFCSELKEELCGGVSEYCCQRAELYGMLLFCERFSPSLIKLTSGAADTLKKLAVLADRLCGAEFEIVRHAGCFTAVAEDGDAAACYHKMGHSEETPLSIIESNLKSPCCVDSFIRGAFLASGSVNNPSAGYYMEFTTAYRKLAGSFAKLLLGRGLTPKITERKGNMVVYLKKSTQVEDALAMMGAVGKAFEIMNVKILKDIKNHQNRINNFDVANLGKTVSASARQCEAIEKIKAAGLFDLLPEELRKAGEVRLQNPELSLSEAARLLDPPSSRSGLNHRLQKLIDMAAEL